MNLNWEGGSWKIEKNSLYYDKIFKQINKIIRTWKAKL